MHALPKAIPRRQAMREQVVLVHLLQLCRIVIGFREVYVIAGARRLWNMAEVVAGVWMGCSFVVGVQTAMEGKGFVVGVRTVTEGKGLEAKGDDERICGEPSTLHL